MIWKGLLAFATLAAALMILIPRTGPRPLGPFAVEEIALARLHSSVDAPGTEADPWLLAHALLTLGPDDLAKRQQWLDQLESRWLVRDSDGRRSFPLHRSIGRGEQHPHVVLRVLVEDGATGFASALAADAAMGFTSPKTFEEWNDVAWFLHGMAILASDPASPYRADTPLGESGTTLGELALATLSRVEAADLVVENALAATGPFERPSGAEDPYLAGVYAYTCGGQHLLQAVVAAAVGRLIPEADRPRIARRIEVLIARLDAEEDFRRREEERALAAGISVPRAARERVRSTLKLHGHALETLALAHEALPNARPVIERALATEVDRVRELLRLRVEVLDPEGTIAPRWRSEDPLAWELWFGDGAHALHGLRRARIALEGSH